MITQDQLKELLWYDPESGNFFWKISKQSTKLGDLAGYIHKSTGYRHIMVNGESHKAHRLTWLYHYGCFPKQIDHINRDKLDNRVENLREVNALINKQNMSKLITNTSGYKGVYWYKASGKWRAHITLNGKKIHLGCFDDIDDAVCARMDANVQYHSGNPNPHEDFERMLIQALTGMSV